MNENILTIDTSSLDSTRAITDLKDYIDSTITTISSTGNDLLNADFGNSTLWTSTSGSSDTFVPWGSYYSSYEDQIYKTGDEVLEIIKKIFYENGYNLLENPDPVKEMSNLRGWTVYGTLKPIRNSKVLGAEIAKTINILSACDEITLETDNEVFFDKFKIKITPSTGLVFVDDNISDYYMMDEEADLIISQLQKITEDIRELLIKDESDVNPLLIKGQGTTSQTYVNKNLYSSINYTSFNSALGTIIDNTSLIGLNTGN